MTDPLEIKLAPIRVTRNGRELADDRLVKLSAGELNTLLTQHARDAAQTVVNEYHETVLDYLRQVWQIGYAAGQKAAPEDRGAAPAPAPDFSQLVEALDRQTAAITAPRRTIKDLVANADGELARVMELTLTDLPETAA